MTHFPMSKCSNGGECQEKKPVVEDSTFHRYLRCELWWDWPLW